MNLWGRHPVCRFGRHLAARNSGRDAPPTGRLEARPTSPRFMVPMHAQSEWRLSVNRSAGLQARRANGNDSRRIGDLGPASRFTVGSPPNRYGVLILKKRIPL